MTDVYVTSLSAKALAEIDPVPPASGVEVTYISVKALSQISELDPIDGFQVSSMETKVMVGLADTPPVDGFQVSSMEIKMLVSYVPSTIGEKGLVCNGVNCDVLLLDSLVRQPTRQNQDVGSGFSTYVMNCSALILKGGATIPKPTIPTGQSTCRVLLDVLVKGN